MGSGALSTWCCGDGQPVHRRLQQLSGERQGKYLATRFRSGFVGSVLSFGISARSPKPRGHRVHLALGNGRGYWRRPSPGLRAVHATKGFDVREGFLVLEGPWGTRRRRTSIRASSAALPPKSIISTPTLTASGFRVSTSTTRLAVTWEPARSRPDLRPGSFTPRPTLNGREVEVGFYDPQRLLGAWERVPYPRVGRRPDVRTEAFAGPVVQAGGRGHVPDGEAARWDGRVARSGALPAVAVSRRDRFGSGFRRFGDAAWASYVALQNATSTFSNKRLTDRALRSFTGSLRPNRGSSAVPGNSRWALGA